MIPSVTSMELYADPGKTWRKPFFSTTASGVLNSVLSSVGFSNASGEPLFTIVPPSRNSTRSISGTIVSTRWVTCTTELALLLFNSL